MIFVMFHGAGTQGITLVSQQGHGVGTLQSSLTCFSLLVYPSLWRYKKGSECSQFSHSSLILLPQSECEKGWGIQLLHRIALLCTGNNLC